MMINDRDFSIKYGNYYNNTNQMIHTDPKPKKVLQPIEEQPVQPIFDNNVVAQNSNNDRIIKKLPIPETKKNNDEDMQEEYTWAKSHQDTKEDYSNMLEDTVTLADSVSEIDITDTTERQQNSYTGVDTPKTNPNIDKLMLLDQNLADVYNASNSKDDIELY